MDAVDDACQGARAPIDLERIAGGGQDGAGVGQGRCSADGAWDGPILWTLG
jgi:hypothetical protein